MSKASLFVIIFIKVPGKVRRIPYLNMKRLLFYTDALNLPRTVIPVKKN